MFARILGELQESTSSVVAVLKYPNEIVNFISNLKAYLKKKQSEQFLYNLYNNNFFL